MKKLKSLSSSSKAISRCSKKLKTFLSSKKALSRCSKKLKTLLSSKKDISRCSKKLKTLLSSEDNKSAYNQKSDSICLPQQKDNLPPPAVQFNLPPPTEHFNLLPSALQFDLPPHALEVRVQSTSFQMIVPPPEHLKTKIFENSNDIPQFVWDGHRWFSVKDCVGRTTEGIEIYDSALITLKPFEVSPSFNLLMVHNTNEIDLLTLKLRIFEFNSKIPSVSHQLLHIESVFDYGGFYCVVIPGCDKGSIRTLLFENCPMGFPEDLVAVVLYKVLKGLSVLHEEGVFHGEISAGHIYLENNFNFKLGFGATVFDKCVDFDLLSKNECCALKDVYGWGAAPEKFHYPHKWGREADVWSIGMLALELLYGKRVMLNKDGLDRVLKWMWEKKRLYHMGFVKKYNLQFEELILQCLEKEPAKRPTILQLLQSPFLLQFESSEYFGEAVSALPIEEENIVSDWLSDS